MLANIYLRGPAHIYWLYPVLIGVFFLLKRGEALVISTLVVIALLPALLGELDPLTISTIIISALLTNAFAHAFATVTRRQRRELIELANKDPLTGAGNRRGLQQKLAEAIALRSRTNRLYSLVMLDLDHFKQINDQHGHAKGDEILVRMTEILRMRIRVTDSIYRIGG